MINIVNLDYNNQYMADSVYLTAEEAAAELNISKASLYSYVSRGRVRSQQAGGKKRSRLYRAEDVRALRVKKDKGRKQHAGEANSFRWDAPMLDSAITYIGPEGLYYRGRDACSLAAGSSVEHVATLLWDVEDRDPFGQVLPGKIASAYESAIGKLGALGPIERSQALLPFMAASDPAAFATRGPAAVETAGRILRSVCAALVGAPLSPRPVAAIVAEGLNVSGDDADLVRMALILCADHELNVSAFTVRCAISAGAPLYAGVAAGIAAFQGYRHGGATERARNFVDAALSGSDIEGFVRAQMRRGETIPGFGHPLYPDGDVRAAMLLRVLTDRFDDDETLRRAHDLMDAVGSMAGTRPNIDFAIALLSRLLDLPRDAGLAIFAAGRCAGWLAHALEQASKDMLIRPRANYTGAPPSPERLANR